MKKKLTMMTAVATLGTVSMASAEKINIYAWSQSIEPKILEKFTKETGHDVSSVAMVHGLVGHNQGISLLVTDAGQSLTYDGKRVVSIPLTETVNPSSIHIVNALGTTMHDTGRNFIDFCCANQDLFK